jgi:hypothetical protein
MKYFLRALILLLNFIITEKQVTAQRYLVDYDSTLYIRDTVRPFLTRM